MNLSLKEILKHASRNSITVDLNQNPKGFTQDTRKLKAGEIYVAIKGDNFDGHDFIQEAFDKGALACLVSQSDLDFDNLIFSDDTVETLGKLANHYRQAFSGKVIAITGSSGKTTTKELLKSALSEIGTVMATKGNYNNFIGLPLTLLNTSSDKDFNIIEMGMSSAGEIRYLSKITEPDVGLITNIGPAHLEYFENGLEGIAQAKGELFDELKPENFAIVNLDDEWLTKLSTTAQKITYSFQDSQAEVFGKVLEADENGTVLQIGDDRIKIKQAGQHMVSNVLSVLAIGNALKLDTKKLISGIEGYEPLENRGGMSQVGEVTFFDDTYNANPSSVVARLEGVQQRFPEKNKIAILGDMLELGEKAESYHLQVGQKAKSLGFQEVFGFGKFGNKIAQGFYGENRGDRSFQDKPLLKQSLKNLLKEYSEVILLFKGSRGMQMETLVEDLKKDLENAI